MKVWNKIKQNENLMRFIETTQKRITDSEMSTTSVVVAYYLLLSLFPLIIAFGNILPFLHIDQETVLTYLREVIPVYRSCNQRPFDTKFRRLVIRFCISGFMVCKSKYQCFANCDE